MIQLEFVEFQTLDIELTKANQMTVLESGCRNCSSEQANLVQAEIADIRYQETELHTTVQNWHLHTEFVELCSFLPFDYRDVDHVDSDMMHSQDTELQTVAHQIHRDTAFDH